MRTNLTRAAAILAIGSTLGACATNFVPVAGSGAVAPDQIERDRAECRQQADANAKALGKAAAGTAIGGFVGAAEGATSGIIFDAPGEGALIGLAVGAVIGLVAGIAAASERDPALDFCMAGRGYRAQ